MNESYAYFHKVPPSWTKRAYASLNGLSAWYVDLLARLKELESWTSDFNLPNSVWLSGFFNPQSFLTAIMQSTARRCELPLDNMCLVCEVTKKNREEVTQPPKEGAFVHGLFMEVTLDIEASTELMIIQRVLVGMWISIPSLTQGSKNFIL